MYDHYLPIFDKPNHFDVRHGDKTDKCHRYPFLSLGYKYRREGYYPNLPSSIYLKLCSIQHAYFRQSEYPHRVRFYHAALAPHRDRRKRYE